MSYHIYVTTVKEKNDRGFQGKQEEYVGGVEKREEKKRNMQLYSQRNYIEHMCEILRGIKLYQIYNHMLPFKSKVNFDH